MKSHGIDKFAARLDEIFEQGNPTKAQILDAYNKASSPPSAEGATAEEILADIYGCRDIDELQRYFISNDISLVMILEAMNKFAAQRQPQPTIAKTETDTGHLIDMPNLTCWNCGAELRYLPNGRTTYRCACGAIDPSERQPQPTAEGAEEILAKEQFEAIVKSTCEDVWHGRRSLNPVKDQTDLIVERLYPLFENAALHAQKLADKMVEERLREELITYTMETGLEDKEQATKIVTEYLKSREK